MVSNRKFYDRHSSFEDKTLNFRPETEKKRKDDDIKVKGGFVYLRRSTFLPMYVPSSLRF